MCSTGTSFLAESESESGEMGKVQNRRICLRLFDVLNIKPGLVKELRAKSRFRLSTITCTSPLIFARFVREAGSHFLLFRFDNHGQSPQYGYV
jgi:hypothetical protein